MNTKNTKLRSTIMSIVLILLALTSSIYGFFAVNGTDIAFIPENPGGESTSLPKAYISIGSLISNGTGFFLKSHSDMILFLNMIELSELSGLDYVEFRKTFDSACDNLEQAREKYYQLKNLAALTPYNQEVIDKLRAFDYEGFQRAKGLNSVVFEKVKRFLSIGNVRGVYNLFYEDLDYLFEHLKCLKSIVDSGSVPEISELWRINQKYAELQFFGQYVTEVFYELR